MPRMKGRPDPGYYDRLRRQRRKHMEAAWIAAGRPTETYGSKGQLVPHLYISESRQHFSTSTRLLTSLKLPTLDEEDDASEKQCSNCKIIRPRSAFNRAPDKAHGMVQFVFCGR